MDLLGRGLLVLALLVAAYGAVASIVGARRLQHAGGPAVDDGSLNTHGSAFVRSGRRAIYLVALMTTACFVLVEIAFIRTDLTFDVVASHSSATTPLGYRMAAPWSSQEGSLLLWVWLLSLWSSLVVRLAGRRMADVVPWAQAVLLGLSVFFLLLLVFYSSPFRLSSPVPLQGEGLNPLLQYPSMMIHPPMLYSGYTLFAVPFAFAVGALAAGHVGSDWIRHTRRYALGAWLLPDVDKLHKVTIIPRGRALGVTQLVPEEDRMNIGESALMNRLVLGLAGRAAEKIVFGDYTAGAENDLQNATRIARKMVATWGMSERVGPVACSTSNEHPFLGRDVYEHREFSERTAQIIDEEVTRILNEAAERAVKLLSENRDKLDRLAGALEAREMLDDTEVAEIIGPATPRRAGESMPGSDPAPVQAARDSNPA